MKERAIKSNGMCGSNPIVASAALLATGFMRSVAIKRYAPIARGREVRLVVNRPETHKARCLIFREKSLGVFPTIVLGGFVPDATETVEFQRQILRRHGSIYYVNYPRTGFCAEMFAAQLGDLIDEILRKGQKPLIMSVSFGSGLLLDFLQHADEQIHESIRGLILISPVICTDDLIRPATERREGVRLLESNLKKIMAADPHTDIEKHIERSRRCFQSLFTAGAENRQLSVRHLTIRKKIMDVINHTSVQGGFERVLTLGKFIFPAGSGSLFAGPVLSLLAENEEDTLVQSSPTLGMFRDPAQFRGFFPNSQVSTVRSGVTGDGVAHASLIFHHEAYNHLIAGWYNKLLYPRLQLAV